MMVSYLHLLLSNLSFAFFGAAFWFVAAKLYPPSDVGVGSALTNISFLFILFSSAGIGPALIRFIPEENKDNLVNSLLWLSIISCFVISLIFILGIDIFLPKMYILKKPFLGAALILFSLTLLIFTLSDSIYISFRQTKLVLIKNLLQGFLKVTFIFLFPILEGFWIFSCSGLSAMLAVFITTYMLFKKVENIKFKFLINIPLIKKIFPFVLVNSIGSFSFVLPGIILPLFIFANFPKEYAGYFYIAWTIFMTYASFVTSGMSIFLMEGSYEGFKVSSIRRVALLSFLLIVIGIIGILVLGDRLLLFFGPEYVRNASYIIKILFFSLVFFGTNQLFLTIRNIEKDITAVAILNIIIIFSLIISSLYLKSRGLETGALGWMTSQIMGFMFVIVSSIMRKCAMK